MGCSSAVPLIPLNVPDDLCLSHLERLTALILATTLDLSATTLSVQTPPPLPHRPFPSSPALRFPVGPTHFLLFGTFYPFDDSRLHVVPSSLASCLFS
jgi:hypothetical protein